MLCQTKYKQSPYKAMLIIYYQVFDHIISPKKMKFECMKDQSKSRPN
jgi:hypothetical protein